MPITFNTTNQDIFKNFESIKNYRSAKSCEPKNNQPDQKKEKINLPVLSSTILGVLTSLFIIKKYKGNSIEQGIKLIKQEGIKNKLISLKDGFLSLFKSKIDELKDIYVLAAGSVLGGLAGGIITDKENHTKSKTKEGIYQFLNIVIPATFVDGLLNLTEKHKKLDNKYAKVAAFILGIGAGMPISAWVSHKINSSFIDKEDKCKRPMKLKDCVVHADDICTAVTVSNPELANKLFIDKLLPLLYLIGGYEAGNKK